MESDEDSKSADERTLRDVALLIVEAVDDLKQMMENMQHRMERHDRMIVKMFRTVMCQAGKDDLSRWKKKNRAEVEEADEDEGDEDEGEDEEGEEEGEEQAGESEAVEGGESTAEAEGTEKEVEKAEMEVDADADGMEVDEEAEKEGDSSEM